MATSKIDVFTISSKINEDQDPAKVDLISYINSIEAKTNETYAKVCGSKSYSSTCKAHKTIKVNKGDQCINHHYRKSYINFLKPNKIEKPSIKEPSMKSKLLKNNLLTLILEENDNLRESGVIINQNQVSSTKAYLTSNTKTYQQNRLIFSPVGKHDQVKSASVQNKFAVKLNKICNQRLSKQSSQLTESMSTSVCDINNNFGGDVSCTEANIREQESSKLQSKHKFNLIIKKTKLNKRSSSDCAFIDYRLFKPEDKEVSNSSACNFIQNSIDLRTSECNNKLDLSSSSDEQIDKRSYFKIKKNKSTTRTNRKELLTSKNQVLSSANLNILKNLDMSCPGESATSKQKEVLPLIITESKSTTNLISGPSTTKEKLTQQLRQASKSKDIISKCNAAYEKSELIRDEIVKSDKSQTNDENLNVFKDNLRIAIGKHYLLSEEAKVLQAGKDANNKGTFVYYSRGNIHKKKFISSDESSMLVKSEAISTLSSHNAYKFKNYLEGKFKIGLDKQDVYGLTNDRQAINIKDKIILDPLKLKIAPNNMFDEVDKVLDKGIKRMSKLQSRFLSNK